MREPAGPSLREALPVIAAGGMIGASARHLVAMVWATRWPAGTAGLPWATLGINALGCLLIGWLMARVEASPGHRLLGHRLLPPFVGIGVLGGFTTFSAYALEIHDLLRAGATVLAIVYLWLTVVVAVLAVAAGASLGRSGPAAPRARTTTL
ncbi:MAG: fluoride efflux transporter FluC [Nocardioides sp.]